MDSDGVLPASIEIAWGVRERPTKGPKRGLSLERIVEAGVKVAASEGLAAVSMSRVAAELGASTMSLYRYVGAKHELLALMVDAAFGEPPELSTTEGWRAGLTSWAWTEIAAYNRHPWVLRVPISGGPVTPNQMAFVEQGLRCFKDTGLTEVEKMSVILVVTSYVRSVATLGADMRATSSEALVDMSSYGRALSTVADPGRFPELTAVIAAGTFDDDPESPDFDPNYEFVFGLDRILDGIEVLIRSREKAT